jgi:NAD-dependent SIR2 family protein deacetylase
MLESVRRVADAISCATALVVTTGRGVSPDGLVVETANDLRADPARAWGGYARRRHAMRLAPVLGGVGHLVRWADAAKDGAFAITTAIDGHLQRGHFCADRVMEVDGAMEWLQCARKCSGDVFPGGTVDVRVEEESGCASEPLPACPTCGELARPNVRLLGDEAWEDARAREQGNALDEWLAAARARVGRRVVVLECGVHDRELRARGERIAAATGGLFVRVNEVDAGVGLGAIGARATVTHTLNQIAIELPASR